MTYSLPPINLNYCFGSGGFYALWIIILGTKNAYKIRFSNNKSIYETFRDHWNIGELENWKETEVWPDRNNDFNFICNPQPEQWQNQRGKRIIVYTDVYTQYKLAKAKRAGPWSPNWNENFKATNPLCMYQDVYNSIKKDDWPTVNSWDEILNLPKNITKELEELDYMVMNTPYETYVQNSSKEWNGIRVCRMIYDHLNEADFICDLKEIVDTNGGALLKYFNADVNEECVAFTSLYKKLNKGLLDEP